MNYRISENRFQVAKFGVKFYIKGGNYMKRTRSTYNKRYLEKLGNAGKSAPAKGNRRFYSDLRLKEKAANERMRQLEKAGINSPAYQAIQAKLEVLGKQTKGNRGRRFSETGKATYNEKELLNKILDEFLNYDTSTLSGARRYNESVWTNANKNNKLAEAGISRDEWLKFWESMPDRADRLYGSSQIVAIVRAYSMKNGNLEDEDKFSVEEIAEEIQASKNLKDAYRKLGLSTDEVQSARIRRKARA